MSDKKNILFFSNYCNHCKEIIGEINKSSLQNSFKFICVDNTKVPQYITSVPTLISAGYNKPIVGEQIVQFLNQYVQQNAQQAQNTPQNVHPSSMQNNQGNNANQSSESGPVAWHGGEMGSSYSDNYSFLDSDTSAQGDGGSRLSHNFEFLGGNASNSQINTPGDNSSQDSSRNVQQDELTQNMERMMQQRDSEIPQGINRI